MIMIKSRMNIVDGNQAVELPTLDEVKTLNELKNS